ncbi:MAG: hypothetical protein GY915_02900 [bacterium]|nr:hypothetical protein [bacterium]
MKFSTLSIVLSFLFVQSHVNASTFIGPCPEFSEQVFDDGSLIRIQRMTYEEERDINNELKEGGSDFYDIESTALPPTTPFSNRIRNYYNTPGLIIGDWGIFYGENSIFKPQIIGLYSFFLQPGSQGLGVLPEDLDYSIQKEEIDADTMEEGRDFFTKIPTYTENLIFETGIKLVEKHRGKGLGSKVQSIIVKSMIDPCLGEELYVPPLYPEKGRNSVPLGILVAVEGKIDYHNVPSLMTARSAGILPYHCGDMVTVRYPPENEDSDWCTKEIVLAISNLIDSQNKEEDIQNLLYLIPESSEHLRNSLRAPLHN